VRIGSLEDASVSEPGFCAEAARGTTGPNRNRIQVSWTNLLVDEGMRKPLKGFMGMVPELERMIPPYGLYYTGYGYTSRSETNVIA
jgi:hypothetical protein